MRQALGPGALGRRPRGSGWRGRWEGGSGWGTHVNPWLFHFSVWQNPIQLKKKLKKKKKKEKKVLRVVIQTVLVVNNPPAKAGDLTGMDSIPGLGRSPGGGHSNPLQYSCLENPRDRRAWRATVYSVAKSRTRLKRLSTYTQCCDPVILVLGIQLTEMLMIIHQKTCLRVIKEVLTVIVST